MTPQIQDYVPLDIYDRFPDQGTAQRILALFFINALVLWTFRAVRRLFFHPLSRYPGPRIAAVSDIWYAYHSLLGRWPWAVEDVLKKYGDVVRIAPNELVFTTPQALADIYGSRHKNLELFPKTQINNHGNDKRGGLIWEWDPSRHREVAKQLGPAFKGSALKAKEPTLHRHIDHFVERMETLGSGPEAREQLESRIRRKSSPPHFDFFEQMVTENHELPKDRDERRHLEQVAGQLLIAGYEPPAIWLYFTLYHLLMSPGNLGTLTREIKDAFGSYGEISPSSAARLPYLTACLQEALRTMPNVLTGMPVVVCQSSMFALARSPRNFRDPLQFRPERWLSRGHPLHNARFDGHRRKDFQPFSMGPRMCAGKEIAWWQSRLFMAKILWVFDLEMVTGQQIDMDRDLRGWGMVVKPEFRVRFTTAARAKNTGVIH
ncbi:hypothetical protein PG987_010483 [Apiospora arundinis]